MRSIMQSFSEIVSTIFTLWKDAVKRDLHYMLAEVTFMRIMYLFIHVYMCIMHSLMHVYVLFIHSHMYTYY